MNYIGIDHHKQYSHMTIMDEAGKVLKAGNVLNIRNEVEDFLEGKAEETKAVIEAGGSTSLPTSQRISLNPWIVKGLFFQNQEVLSQSNLNAS